MDILTSNLNASPSMNVLKYALVLVCVCVIYMSMDICSSPSVASGVCLQMLASFPSLSHSVGFNSRKLEETIQGFLCNHVLLEGREC